MPTNYNIFSINQRPYFKDPFSAQRDAWPGNYRLYAKAVVLSFFISIFAKKITGSNTELLCAKFYKCFLCKI